MSFTVDPTIAGAAAALEQNARRSTVKFAQEDHVIREDGEAGEKQDAVSPMRSLPKAPRPSVATSRGSVVPGGPLSDMMHAAAMEKAVQIYAAQLASGEISPPASVATPQSNSHALRAKFAATGKSYSAMSQDWRDYDYEDEANTILPVDTSAAIKGGLDKKRIMRSSTLQSIKESSTPQHDTRQRTLSDFGFMGAPDLSMLMQANDRRKTINGPRKSHIGTSTAIAREQNRAIELLQAHNTLLAQIGNYHAATRNAEDLTSPTPSERSTAPSPEKDFEDEAKEIMSQMHGSVNPPRGSVAASQQSRQSRTGNANRESVMSTMTGRDSLDYYQQSRHMAAIAAATQEFQHAQMQQAAAAQATAAALAAAAQQPSSEKALLHHMGIAGSAQQDTCTTQSPSGSPNNGCDAAAAQMGGDPMQMNMFAQAMGMPPTTDPSTGQPVNMANPGMPFMNPYMPMGNPYMAGMMGGMNPYMANAGMPPAMQPGAYTPALQMQQLQQMYTSALGQMQALQQAQAAHSVNMQQADIATRDEVGRPSHGDLGVFNHHASRETSSFRESTGVSISPSKEASSTKRGKQIQTAHGVITIPPGHSVAPQRRNARKAAGNKRRGSNSDPAKKFTSRFLVPDEIAATHAFRATSYLIGKGGQHMKRISQETDAKLRVRGRFSGHLEGPRMQESDDPLQLCVSAPSEESHKRAQEMVRELFVEMFSAFKRFKQEGDGDPMPDFEIKIVEP